MALAAHRDHEVAKLLSIAEHYANGFKYVMPFHTVVLLRFFVTY